MKVSFYVTDEFTESKSTEVCSRDMNMPPRIGEMVYFNGRHRVIDVQWDVISVDMPSAIAIMKREEL